MGTYIARGTFETACGSCRSCGRQTRTRRPQGPWTPTQRPPAPTATTGPAPSDRLSGPSAAGSISSRNRSPPRLLLVSLQLTLGARSPSARHDSDAEAGLPAEPSSRPRRAPRARITLEMLRRSLESTVPSSAPIVGRLLNVRGNALRRSPRPWAVEVHLGASNDKRKRTQDLLEDCAGVSDYVVIRHDPKARLPFLDRRNLSSVIVR